MSGPVVAGVDGSRRSLAAAEWAAREALARGAALRTEHARPLAAAQGLARTQHGRLAAGDVVLLNPARALVKASERTQLLVVGRRTSPRAAERHLGPVTHAVLHHVQCLVAVVPNRV